MSIETTSDIIAEMNRYAQGMDKRYEEADEGDKSLSCDVIAFRMRVFADRLETAHMRELNKMQRRVRRYLKPIADVFKGLSHGLDTSIGREMARLMSQSIRAFSPIEPRRTEKERQQ